MIVIPAHNSPHLINNFLNKIEEFGSGGHRVVIVNTHSDDPEAIDNLKRLEYRYTLINCIDNCGYEAGALVTALRQLDFNSEEKIILTHDSTYPISTEWVKEFERNTDENQVTAYCTFQPLFIGCDQERIDYSLRHVNGCDSIPHNGIFGSIFCANASTLKRVDEAGYFHTLPSCKMHSECWERIFPLIFCKMGINVNSLIPFWRQGAFDESYLHFQKRYALRG